MSVGVHPERTPDPLVVRWRHVDAAAPPPPGRALTVPPSLRAAGVVDLVADDHGLVLRLGERGRWAEAGGPVRDALVALLETGGWSAAEGTVSAPSSTGPDDAALAAATRAVLASDVALVADAHGGAIELLDAHDGVVTVRMSGACDGCPAAAMTLNRRLQDAVSLRVGADVEVRAESVTRASSRLGPGGRQLLKWAHDRHRRRND